MRLSLLTVPSYEWKGKETEVTIQTVLGINKVLTILFLKKKYKIQIKHCRSSQIPRASEYNCVVLGTPKSFESS